VSACVSGVLLAKTGAVLSPLTIMMMMMMACVVVVVVVVVEEDGAVLQRQPHGECVQATQSQKLNALARRCRCHCYGCCPKASSFDGVDKGVRHDTHWASR
jgi:hypothetical protein